MSPRFRPRLHPPGAGVASVLAAVTFAAAAAGDTPADRVAAGATEDRSAAASARPNVILVVLDTARRDHFSTYGYGLETTPVFSALAAEGIRFDQAYSTSSWTVPAHASLFTGLYPAEHGANQETQYLSDDARTLAEILAAHGYQTASFSGNPWVSPLANLAQGFDRHEVSWASTAQPEGTGLPHGQIRRALGWIDARDPSRPFLLFVNIIEPHWRYQAPAYLQRRFVPGGREVSQEDPAMFPAFRGYLAPERIRPEDVPVRTGMYDADLAFADTILGQFLDGVRKRGLLDGALVVVTADHGENHGDGEHYAHMLALNEPLIRVPLVMRLPDGTRAGTVRTDPVQLPDIFATVLAAADVSSPPAALPVHDLLAAPVPADRPILAEYAWPRQVLTSFPKRASENPRLQPFLRKIRAIRVGDEKLVRGSDGRTELYDLAADPAETRDLHPERPERAAELLELLDELLARAAASALVVADSAAASPKSAMSPEEEEQLRALGYVR